MKNTTHLPVIESIRRSGVVVMNTPSINYPIPVAVFYRNNRDGSVGSLWPKGNLQADTAAINGGSQVNNKWAPRLHRVFFALGLESLLADGRLVLYTDLPTATYLQNDWRWN